MVITSATLIAFAGASVMDQYRELAGQESTTNAIEEIDTELSSVASVGGKTRAEFSLGDARPSQYRIVSSGHVNVTANRNTTCRAKIPLSSLRYERDDGVLIGFEGGAIWRQQGGLVSQTAMHTPPDLTFENGTLSMTIVNVSGQIQGSENLVYENVSRSIQTNRNIQDSLFQGKCSRPNNVTISVTSDFYRGWNGYLHNSINGTSYSTFDSNNTARVFLDQSVLPRETDDYSNDVVDLTNQSDYNDVKVTNNSIEVKKGADVTYTTIVTPLTSGSAQVGEIRVVEDGSAYRPPMDVVFVIDESGSMGDDPDGDGESKAVEAQDAARACVRQMKGSDDRAGVVGYNDSNGGWPYYSPEPSHFHTTQDGEYLTDDFGSPGPTALDGINGSINGLVANGGTNMGAGVHDGNVMFGLQSNSSRNKVMILLADGQNSDTAYRDNAFDEAEIADKDGITIHTVGFGDLSSQANQTMEDIAQTTGGTYRYVDDSGDLSAVFVDLFAEISESKQIVRDPFSMQLQAGSTTYYPQIDGDTTHVANGSDEELNLNDPTAPANFSYSIDVSDGQNVSMTALDYECLSWERTGNVYENETTGQEYAEVRCAEIDDSTRTEVSPSNTSVYVDGDNVSSLLDQPSNWWDEDLENETLAPYLVGANNDTLELNSNEAIVVFKFEDDDGATDRLIVHYEMGQSEQEAVPKYIFNLEVRYLVVGEES